MTSLPYYVLCPITKIDYVLHRPLTISDFIVYFLVDCCHVFGVELHFFVEIGKDYLVDARGKESHSAENRPYFLHFVAFKK